MQKLIEKVSISEHPEVQVNCHLFLIHDDLELKKDNACTTVPFQVPLSEMVDFTTEQIDEHIKEIGQTVFDSEDTQLKIKAIDAAKNVVLGTLQ